MSKFNFDQSATKQEFQPIQIKRACNKQAVTKPIVSISKTTLRFNAFFSKGMTQYSYIQFMLKGNLLAFRFLKEEPADKNALKLRTGDDKAFTASFTSIYNHLKEYADSVNLDAFNYRYLVEQDDETIFFVDLSKPRDKSRRKKRK